MVPDVWAIFGQFWNNITEAQAIFLSGVSTLLAALFAVTLGARAFGNRVISLKDAIAASQDQLNQHLDDIEACTKEAIDMQDKLSASLEERSETIDELVGAITRKLSEIDTQFQDRSDGDLRASGIIATSGSAGNDDARADLVEAWRDIRSVLEDYAFSYFVDGRTRAKYLRQDKRNYRQYFEMVANDTIGPNGAPVIPRGIVDTFRESVDFWLAKRSGRSTVTDDDAEKMNALRAVILDFQRREAAL